MSSQSSGVPIIVEKGGDVHTESIQQSQPIDLAAHRGPAVVQLRPVRTFSGLPHHGTITAKPAGGPTAAVAGTQTSIISVNRTGPNLTILPARGQPGGAPAQIPTYQIARGTIVGNVRSNITSGHHQPGSITVTPISASNFGTNIRLTGPVNNGTWIQSSGNPPGAFAPLRAATITVSGRAVRPDGKMIHIPQGGSVQHVTQLQMVDNKGSILKPQLTTTPIMRGTLHPQGGTNTGTPLTLPIAPFTIRAANIANLPTIQQRPQNANANTANQVQKGGEVKPSLPKVITSPAHGPPIQLLNAQKLSHSIQTIPIPRLNTVCLTLSTHGKGTIAPNNTAPVVAMASRQGNTSLIMTPSISGQVPSGGSTTLPNITKVYPVSRDVTPVVETFFAATSQQGGTVSTTGGTMTTVNPISHNLSGGGSGPQTNVVIASSTPSNTHHHLVPAHGANSAHHHGHHLVQVHGSISVNSGGVGTVGLSPSTMTQSYYHVDPNNFTHGRPIAIEKRTVTSDASKGIMTGSTVILTSAQNQPQHHSTQVTLAAHGAFSHSIPMSHHHQQQQSQQILQSHSILTPVSSSMGGGGGGITTISSIPGIQQQAQHVQIGHSAIPTHVISQTQPANISSSSSSSSASVISVTPSSTATTVPLSVANPPTSSVIVTTSSTNNNIINNHSMNSSNSNAVLASSSSASSSSTSVTSSSSTCPVIITTTATSCSNSLQTSTPAQSPSQQTKSTLSPRPSILRKREAGDNHHALPLRAQRNLAFSVGSSNVQMAASASAAAAAAANKENSVVVTTTSNSVSSVSLGPSSLSLSSLSSTPLAVAPSTAIVPGNMSILKKEFQPPNEESSWQSCSSNSSSGSTTISTTSETAEIQLQQQQQQIPLSSSANIGLHVPTVSVGLGDIPLGGNYTSMSNINNILGSSIGCSSGNGGAASATSEQPQQGHSVSQNGIVRSVSSVRSKASGKSTLKDLERGKGRQEKDDGVSPRKKPRKQQLTTSDLFDSASPEISFYQGKRFKGHFKKSELMDPKMFEEFNERLSEENAIEEAPSIKGVTYYIKKPHMSLLQSNKFQSKPPHNHFQRYCDVKSKDERRPTVNDLLSQKNVMQKADGWKLQHLIIQVEQVIAMEGDVVHRFSDLLTKLETKIGPNCSDRDLNRIMELLKGNIQRGKVIRDQMLESKTQVLKILEHKPRILDVITKYNSKRPIKKRERL